MRVQIGAKNIVQMPQNPSVSDFPVEEGGVLVGVGVVSDIEVLWLVADLVEYGKMWVWADDWRYAAGGE